MCMRFFLVKNYYIIIFLNILLEVHEFLYLHIAYQHISRNVFFSNIFNTNFLVFYAPVLCYLFCNIKS